MIAHPINKTISVREAIANLEAEFRYSISPSDFISLLKIVKDSTDTGTIEHRQFDLIRSLIHNWKGYK
jgi:hypothetical protein